MATDALGPTTVISTQGEAKSGLEAFLRWTWRAALALLWILLVGLAVLVSVGEIYEPGDDFGYYLGLAGGLLMLSQMLYPLRKRIPWLSRLGMMDRWFKYHMVIGIAGPVLVLFHSTFKTGSTNGSIALYAMLLVAGSGIVGRFFYRRIHAGLYGRQLTLGDVTTELKASLDNVGSVFAMRQDLEPRLMGFYRDAFASDLGLLRRAWRFMTIRLRGRRLALVIRADIKSSLRRLRRHNQISRAESILSYKLAKQQVTGFIRAVVQAAQFRLWERFFSLWHVVHVPFLYLLVFAGIVHVIAVHMY